MILSNYKYTILQDYTMTKTLSIDDEIYMKLVKEVTARKEQDNTFNLKRLVAEKLS